MWPDFECMVVAAITCLLRDEPALDLFVQVARKRRFALVRWLRDVVGIPDYDTVATAVQHLAEQETDDSLYHLDKDALRHAEDTIAPCPLNPVKPLYCTASSSKTNSLVNLIVWRASRNSGHESANAELAASYVSQSSPASCVIA